ncbi:MAG: hypothetical protein H7A33_06295 [Deltaproteobacteria bacterium]|nr:hypothetical protein [Deltaproteobacteria bacterium]
MLKVIQHPLVCQSAFGASMALVVSQFHKATRFWIPAAAAGVFLLFLIAGLPNTLSEMQIPLCWVLGAYLMHRHLDHKEENEIWEIKQELIKTNLADKPPLPENVIDFEAARHKARRPESDEWLGNHRF